MASSTSVPLTVDLSADGETAELRFRDHPPIAVAGSDLEQAAVILLTLAQQWRKARRPGMEPVLRATGFGIAPGQPADTLRLYFPGNLTLAIGLTADMWKALGQHFQRSQRKDGRAPH